MHRDCTLVSDVLATKCLELPEPQCVLTGPGHTSVPTFQPRPLSLVASPTASLPVAHINCTCHVYNHFIVLNHPFCEPGAREHAPEENTTTPTGQYFLSPCCFLGQLKTLCRQVWGRKGGVLSPQAQQGGGRRNQDGNTEGNRARRSQMRAAKAKRGRYLPPFSL